MSITINQADLGRFTSLSQKRAYDRARTIMSECNQLAELARGFDNRLEDHNSDAGSVLLDGASQYNSTYTRGTAKLEGSCTFDESGCVTSLAMTGVQSWESDSRACRVEHEKSVSGQISQAGGVTTYQTVDGTVMVNERTGTLTIEEGPGTRQTCEYQRNKWNPY